eukprot:scaffold301_cov142-Isochrysis_galbana.AAC.5
MSSLEDVPTSKVIWGNKVDNSFSGNMVPFFHSWPVPGPCFTRRARRPQSPDMIEPGPVGAQIEAQC